MIVGVRKKMLEIIQAIYKNYTYDPESGIVANRHGRIVTRNAGVLGKQYRPYQIAFALMSGHIPESIDHEDGDTLNNRWKNLREATRAQQSANTKKAGVRMTPAGKWYYQLQVDGVRYYKGGFPDRETAEQAHTKLCVELQGVFAVQLSRNTKP